MANLTRNSTMMARKNASSGHVDDDVISKHNHRSKSRSSHSLEREKSPSNYTKKEENILSSKKLSYHRAIQVSLAVSEAFVYILL